MASPLHTWWPHPHQDDDTILPIAASGVVAFGAVHAVSCGLQQSLLGVSTGTRAPVPTLCGMVTVVVASWAAHSTAIGTQHYCRARRRKQSIPDSVVYAWQQRPSVRDTSRSLLSFSAYSSSNATIQPYWHTIRICMVGLVCFQLLGGRFWAVAPSSFTHVGSFARGSIAATEQYATSQQRQAIERLGRLFGCHTCGSRQLLRSFQRGALFIGDHQPPKAVAYQLQQQWWRRWLQRPVRFRFYPQCVACSNRQGGILSAATLELAAAKTWNRWLLKPGRLPSLHAAGSGKNAYVHGLRPRLHFGTGGILALLATAEHDQGRARYRKLQTSLEDVWQHPSARWVRTQVAAHTKHLAPDRQWYQDFTKRRLLINTAPTNLLRR